MGANPTIDHQRIVAEERAKVEAMPPGVARGWTVTNAACLRFAALGEDAGLLWKGTGTHYLGYAVDRIVYRDTGALYDCLGDGEGAAVPQWAYEGTVDPSLWRAPVGDLPPEPDPPDDGCLCEECKLVLDRLDVLVDASLKANVYLSDLTELLTTLVGLVHQVIRTQADGTARVGCQVENRVKIGW